MTFDVSSVISAVNSYLYSISDVNKLLTEGETSGKTPGLSGIFQKYLNKAVEDTESSVAQTAESIAASATKESSASSSLTDLDSLTDAEVLSALNDLKGLATSSAFDSSNTGSNSTDSSLSSLLTMSLPDLVDGKKTDTKPQTSQTARVDGALAPATKVADNSMANSITSEITNRFANMDLESQIKQPFQNLDLKSEINQAFRNVDVDAVFDEAFRGVDLSAEIEKSINSHNKMNEAVSYNESRLQAYRRSAKAAAESSTFGDFRL
ncbi:MAG: hypothetical protein K6F75_04565 [Butyrivibrio sp.]|nr:hypothetical protein [Butyrivibrio sp.]